MQLHLIGGCGNGHMFPAINAPDPTAYSLFHKLISEDFGVTSDPVKHNASVSKFRFSAVAVKYQWTTYFISNLLTTKNLALIRVINRDQARAWDE